MYVSLLAHNKYTGKMDGSFYGYSFKEIFVERAQPLSQFKCNFVKFPGLFFLKNAFRNTFQLLRNNKYSNDVFLLPPLLSFISDM